MANILDIVRGLGQAAANAYDGALDESGEPLQLGLKREKGHPVLDSRVMDGFKVRFAADKMIVTYHGEVMMKEIHPRNQFENEIEQKFADILKYLKKEYRKITKDSVSLKEDGEADIMVQSTSRVRNWVQAKKAYIIKGAEGVDKVGRPSNDKLEDSIRKFLDKSTTKKAKNDKAPANPDTPS
tara:strand:+ start:647 stop:1195 length:549 start_codon:yes stop_codon:yes gene_type:complete